MSIRGKHKAHTWLATAVLALAATICTASATTPGPPPVTDWVSPHQRAHPLAGRLWQLSSRTFVEPQVMITAMAKAQFVLLGEKHDNADHHRLQAWVTRAVLAQGRRLAVGFEMFTTDQTAMIAKHLARAPRDAAGLGPATKWAKRGWPRWRHYRPMAQAALDMGLPIIAANLTRATVMTIFSKGYDGLAPDVIARLGLGSPMAPALNAAMGDEIFESHCGYLPRDLTGGMVKVQRARDAHLARAMVDALGVDALKTGKRLDGVILITGNGHGRRDRGVPMHLARMAPGRSIVSLGLIEARPGQTRPDGYGDRFGARTPPFDFAWFTPQHDNADPCQKFKKRLEAIKKKP